MVASANGASRAISLLPVPFLSASMGCLETGYDMRDIHNQGTKYNGSGCLIHGSSVIADSFVAVDFLLKDRPEDAENLLDALRNNFEGYEDLHDPLRRRSGIPQGVKNEKKNRQWKRIFHCLFLPRKHHLKK